MDALAFRCQPDVGQYVLLVPVSAGSVVAFWEKAPGGTTARIFQAGERFPVEVIDGMWPKRNVGLVAFGFTPLWINRRSLPAEYPGLEPVATLPDLSGLA